MKTSANRLVRLIALFKLLKGILLIAVGVGALKMIHIDLARVLAEWAARLGFDPGSRYVGQALLKAAALTPNKIEALAVGSFIYAGLFLTEGIGLWLLKRWAEWFSVIITSSLVPGGLVAPPEVLELDRLDIGFQNYPQMRRSRARM